jgi:hypothetical protein
MFETLFVVWVMHSSTVLNTSWYLVCVMYSIEYLMVFGMCYAQYW